MKGVVYSCEMIMSMRTMTAKIMTMMIINTISQIRKYHANLSAKLDKIVNNDILRPIKYVIKCAF